MANLSQQRRNRILAFLKDLRSTLVDNETALKALNEITTEITAKKYGLVWEEHEEAVDEKLKTQIPVFVEDKSKRIVGNPKLPYNFLLEGDNLHSLKLLEKTHKGKIDVIYIDPPYNTGAKNWKYDNNYIEEHDAFKHSKWISMMFRRLIIAKRLLKDTGVFICAIDENEIADLKLLIEDIFGDGYAVDIVTIIQNPRGIQGDNFSYTSEFALFVYKKHYKVIAETEVEEEEIDWSPLRNWGGESLRTDAKNCFYGIRVKNDKIVGFDDVLEDLNIHPSKNEVRGDEIIVYPIDDSNTEHKWRYARQTVESILPILRVKNSNGIIDIEIGKPYAPYKTVWTDKKYDANAYGTQLINSMVPGNDFDFPKSVWNVYECLYATTKDNPNAVILDFFAGSGTTGHAVQLLNKYLGGNRKYILATNNAVGEKKEKEFYGKNNINIDDPIPDALKNEWLKFENKFGICTSITYPRLKAVNSGFKHKKGFNEVLYEKKFNKTFYNKFDKEKATIDKIVADNRDKYQQVKIILKDEKVKVIGRNEKDNPVAGIPHNLKYYKTDFISRFSEEDDLTDLALQHVTELIQLQNAIDISDKRYALILDEDSADNILADVKSCDQYKAIYITSGILLDTKQQKILKATKAKVYVVPNYYFEAELREVGEL